MSEPVGPTEIEVELRCFAILREQRRVEVERLRVPAGTTARGLYDRLFGGGPLALLRVAFAVNRAYVGGNEVLAEGDEVAFLPPIGGG